jgi:hypothetical protein
MVLRSGTKNTWVLEQTLIMKIENLMNTFKEVITKLLWDYKNVLRKYLEPVERNSKLQALGLHGRDLVESDEITLYHKAFSVIQDIESWIEKNLDTASWYSGIEEFLNHAKRIVSNYQIEGHKVVHTTQTASRAMIHAIQLITLSKELKESDIHRLTHHVETISQYGSFEQQSLLLNALQQNFDKNPELFQLLILKVQPECFSMDEIGDAETVAG